MCFGESARDRGGCGGEAKREHLAEVKKLRMQ